MTFRVQKKYISVHEESETDWTFDEMQVNRIHYSLVSAGRTLYQRAESRSQQIDIVGAQGECCISKYIFAFQILSTAPSVGSGEQE